FGGRLAVRKRCVRPVFALAHLADGPHSLPALANKFHAGRQRGEEFVQFVSRFHHQQSGRLVSQIVQQSRTFLWAVDVNRMTREIERHGIPAMWIAGHRQWSLCTYLCQRVYLASKREPSSVRRKKLQNADKENGKRCASTKPPCLGWPQSATVPSEQSAAE